MKIFFKNDDQGVRPGIFYHLEVGNLEGTSIHQAETLR